MSKIASGSMLSPWLGAVATLLPTIRWTAVWLDLVMVVLSVFSGVFGFCMAGTCFVAGVFNITTNVVRQRQNRRHHNGRRGVAQTYLPQNLAVIIIDFLIAALCVAFFVLGLVNLYAHSFYHAWDARSFAPYDAYYATSWFTGTTGFAWPWTLVGALVSAHYHLFFGVAGAVLRHKERHRFLMAVDDVRADVGPGADADADAVTIVDNGAGMNTSTATEMGTTFNTMKDDKQVRSEKFPPVSV